MTGSDAGASDEEVEAMLSSPSADRDLLLDRCLAMAPRPFVTRVEDGPCQGTWLVLLHDCSWQAFDRVTRYGAASAVRLWPGRAGTFDVRSMRGSVAGTDDAGQLLDRLWSQGRPELGGRREAEEVSRRSVDGDPSVDLRGTLGSLRSGPNARPSGHVARAVASAHRRIVLRGLCAELPPDGAALVRAVLGDAVDVTVDDLRSVATCLTVGNPAWVVQAVCRFPVLAGLFVPPWSEGAPCHWLDEIGTGRDPVVVLRDMLGCLSDDGSGTRVNDGLPDVVVRGFGAAPRAAILDASTLGAFERVRALCVVTAAYHASNPRLPPLSVGEMAAVHKAAGTWTHPILHTSADVVSAMWHEGRVAPLPEGLRDAFESMLASVTVMQSALRCGGGAAKALAVATRLAFPAHRGLASLRRIDATWHAAPGRVEEDLEALRVDHLVRTRGLDADLLTDDVCPHVTDRPVTVDGVTVAPLRSLAAYRAEGLRMRHCIGSYGAAARAAQLLSFSLSGPGEARSTVAYSVSSDGRGLVLRDHKGPRNAEPDPLHAALVAVLWRHLPNPPGMVEAFVAAGRSPVGLDGEVRRLGMRWEDMTAEETGRLVRAHWRNVRVVSQFETPVRR